MATRAQAREAVVALLYAYDLGNQEISDFCDDILEEKKIRNKQKEFALALFNGAKSKLEELDEQIKKHLNKRGLDDIGHIEKAILRLAIFEIKFSELDKPVVINEAIELAKKLASDNAPKFINAILDNIKKEKL